MLLLVHWALKVIIRSQKK